MSERFVTDTLSKADTEFDLSLRPSKFADFVGQGKVRERLQLFVQAAKGRGDVLDHILLFGPPGLGKTTLAYIVGEAMGVAVKSTSGPVMTKAGDLAGLLTNLGKRRHPVYRRNPPPAQGRWRSTCTRRWRIT
jgi:Holliday junction DNA helicase RuvB